MLTECRWLVVVVAILLCACLGADQGLEIDEFSIALSRAAMERTRHSILYDGSYRRIGYPGGDVPPNVGVCTDVVIRAYRALDIDLQQRVHEDMVAHFAAYPQIWNLHKPDSNIDHRRVPNLQAFFSRHGAELPTSSDPLDYHTGDLVTWTVGGNLPHIGIVVDRRSRDGQRPLVVHNIGAGPNLEDILFAYPITGHYRYEDGWDAGTPGS
jgi:hypothetical protein